MCVVTDERITEERLIKRHLAEHEPHHHLRVTATEQHSSKSLIVSHTFTVNM